MRSSTQRSAAPLLTTQRWAKVEHLSPFALDRYCTLPNPLSTHTLKTMSTVSAIETDTLQLPDPYCARIGMFTIPYTNENEGEAWGFLGTLDGHAEVFIISEPWKRGRISAVQTAYGAIAKCGGHSKFWKMTEAEVAAAIPRPVTNTYLSTQPATMHPCWCPIVRLGERLWQGFISHDPAVKPELIKLIELYRRIGDGFDDDKRVYDAEKMLAQYDRLIKKGTRM